MKRVNSSILMSELYNKFFVFFMLINCIVVCCVFVALQGKSIEYLAIQQSIAMI